MKIFLVSASDNDHQKVKRLLEDTEEFKEWHFSLTEQGHPVWFVALQKNRTASWLAEKLGMKMSDDPTLIPNTGIVVEISSYTGYHLKNVWQQLNAWRSL